MNALTCKSMLFVAIAAVAGPVCSVNTAIAEDLDSSGLKPQILSSVNSGSYQALSDGEMSGIVGTASSAYVNTAFGYDPASVSVTANASADGPNAVASTTTTTAATSNGEVGGAAGGGIAYGLYYGYNGWGSSVDWKAAWFQTHR